MVVPSAKMIEAGKTLLRRLDQVRYRVYAALWIFMPETGSWRLVIASPQARRGHREAYRQLHSHVNKLKSSALSPNNITVVDDRDSLIRRLKKAVITNDGIYGFEFSGNTINGEQFPDAYVHRAASSLPAASSTDPCH